MNMKNSIVVISNLIPDNINDLNTSKILLEFAIEWEKRGVKVTLVKNIESKKIFQKYIYKKKYLDNIVSYQIETSFLFYRSNSKIRQFIKDSFLKKYIEYKTEQQNLLLSDLIRSLNVSIVLTHMPKSLLFSFDVVRLIAIPHIHCIHQTDIRYFSDQNYLNKINKVNRIAFRSYAIKRLVNDKVNIKQKNIVAITGIDPDCIDEKEHLLGKWRKLNKIKLLSVCRAIKLKHIDDVIRSLATIDQRIEWEYSIVGDGPELIKWRKLVKKKKLQSRIHFYGWLDKREYLKIMEESHFFILTSYPETLGIVYLESMAKAMVVIGSLGWGVDGIVQNAINGYLVEPNNDNSLQKILLEILTDNWFIENPKILYNSLITIKKYTREEMAYKYLKFIIETDIL